MSFADRVKNAMDKAFSKAGRGAAVSYQGQIRSVYIRTEDLDRWAEAVNNTPGSGGGWTTGRLKNSFSYEIVVDDTLPAGHIQFEFNE